MPTPPDDTTPPRWATIADAAMHSGIPERTLRNWIDRGLIHVTRPSHRRILVNLDEVDAERGAYQPAGRPRPCACRERPPAGIVLSWPEVDLLIPALHDAAEMRAALWAALGGDEAPGANLDQAARYALLGARLGLARAGATGAGAT